MKFDYPVNLTAAQMRKISRGETITLKPEHFVDKSADVLTLVEKTARRVEKAIKNGKGVRVCLGDEEDDISTMTEGGKISLKGVKKAFKKGAEVVKQGAEKGAEVVGKEGKKQSGVVKRKFDKKVVESGLGKRIASELIDVGTQVLLPAAGSAASMALGDPTGMSGAMVGQIAGDQLDKYAARQGYGLFKALHKAGAQNVGITKKTVIKRAKKIGKQAIEISADVGGDAITAYTGNPIAGEAFKVAAKKIGNKAIETGSTKKVLREMKSQAKNIGVEIVDDYVDRNLSGPEKAVVQKAMAGKYPSAKDLIYDYGNSKLEEEVQGVPFTGFGIVKSAKKGMRYGSGNKSRVRHMANSVKDMFGGAIRAPEMASSVIQLGSPYAGVYSAQMNNKVMLPSPQLAGPISSKMGGSFMPAGGRYTGGSFVPSG